MKITLHIERKKKSAADTALAQTIKEAKKELPRLEKRIKFADRVRKRMAKTLVETAQALTDQKEERSQ